MWCKWPESLSTVAKLEKHNRDLETFCTKLYCALHLTCFFAWGGFWIRMSWKDDVKSDTIPKILGVRVKKLFWSPRNHCDTVVPKDQITFLLFLWTEKYQFRNDGLNKGLQPKLWLNFEDLDVMYSLRYCYVALDSLNTLKNETEELHCGRTKKSPLKQNELWEDPTSFLWSESVWRWQLSVMDQKFVRTQL